MDQPRQTDQPVMLDDALLCFDQILKHSEKLQQLKFCCVYSF